ncbi:MAG: 50S ribosomal protein L4 [Atopobiaceae bacterium]
MSKIEVKNVEGQTTQTVELADSVYGITPNIPVVHRVVVAYESSMRQGTHSTKNRAAVSGGGRKPYRQKGTGRARQGTIRAPQFRGGGVVFGPTPHLHLKKVNRKEKKLAMRSVLSGKLADNELIVLDQLGFDKPCTKDAVKVLKNLGLTGKRVAIIVPDDQIDTYLSFRNIPGAEVYGAWEANTRILIDNAALVMTLEVAKHFEEALA